MYDMLIGPQTACSKLFKPTRPDGGSDAPTNEAVTLPRFTSLRSADLFGPDDAE